MKKPEAKLINSLIDALIALNGTEMSLFDHYFRSTNKMGNLTEDYLTHVKRIRELANRVSQDAEAILSLTHPK